MSSRKGRLVGWFAGVVAVGAGLLGACAAQASQAPQASVTLHPASGPTNSTPTWSTNVACPAGFRGSAILRAIKPDGTTFSLSGVTNSVTAPFSGTLLGSISEIQTVAGVRNGGTEKFVVLCWSGPSATGTPRMEMSMYITYSANGASYTTSATAPASASGAGAGAGSTSSSTSTTGSPSPNSTSSVTPAPSPTPVNSTLPVTG